MSAGEGGKIKIVRIITRLNVGGPAIHTIILTKELNSELFSTCLVSGLPDPSEGDMSWLADESGVNVQYVPEMGREVGLRDFAAFFKILKILLRVRPDILHTHTAKAGTLGRLAGFLAGVPVKIHTFHGHVFDGYFNPLKAKIFILIEKALAAITDKVIVVSDAVRSEIVEKLKIVPADKCIVIRLGFDLKNFLDNDKYTGTLRKKLNISSDTLLVGIIGRLVPIKNHKMLLEAARRIIDEAHGMKVKFIIVGDGELRRELEEEAAGMALAKYVVFSGWIRDIAEVYTDLDVVVLTSLNEGTPVSLIEAMASSRPVVATDVGGVRDIIENGKSGYLVKKYDVEDLVAKMRLLFADSTLRSKMGEAGREFVKRTYLKDRLIANTESLYIEMLTRKPSP